MLRVLIAFICALRGAQAQASPSVNITQGTVIGTFNSDGYMSFYGIPYAGSTSGSNRFKREESNIPEVYYQVTENVQTPGTSTYSNVQAPTPPPVFTEEFHALNNSILCAQPTFDGLLGIEDCLVLSIHTTNFSTPKPVIVWIDGDSYESAGRTLYSFTNLVNADLVVVSMNYRLSIFGFLCLGTQEAPGNAGLKDIVQGLKWIQGNIAEFGGDPNNVVLLGHGSGAALADLITLSPMAIGLVHKAIVLSGSAFAPWAVAYTPVRYAKSFAEKIGYTGDNREDLAKFLLTADSDVLANTLSDFKFYDNTMLFSPCVEDVNLNPNDTFLPAAPLSLLSLRNFSHIPYIASHVNNEGTIRVEEAVSSNWLNLMERNFEDFLQADLEFESSEIRTSVAQKIREYYFAQDTIHMNTIQNYFNYHGDTMTVVSTIRGARQRALYSTADVRLLEFTYEGTNNSDWVYPEIPIKGARHGSILNYIFDFDLVYHDEAPKNILTLRFAYFAYNGSQPADRVVWFPITATNMNTLRIAGGEISPNVTSLQEAALGDTDPQRTAFWNGIYATHYIPPNADFGNSSATILSITSIVFIAQLLITLLR